MGAEMKALAEYPQHAHTRHMKYILIVVLACTFVGCKQDRFTNTTARSWDSSPVKLDSIPNGVVPQLLGNIGFLSRVYQVATVPTEVYVRKHNDLGWELLPPGLPQGNETYVYDPVTHEVRFQGCNTAWAYAIYWL